MYNDFEKYFNWKLVLEAKFYYLFSFFAESIQDFLTVMMPEDFIKIFLDKCQLNQLKEVCS